MSIENEIKKIKIKADFLTEILTEINELSYFQIQDGGSIIALLEGKNMGLNASLNSLIEANDKINKISKTD